MLLPEIRSENNSRKSPHNSTECERREETEQQVVGIRGKTQEIEKTIQYLMFSPKKSIFSLMIDALESLICF